MALAPPQRIREVVTMADQRTRERIVELCRQMREHTVEHGCTPGEAAKFAAKVAEYMERYQIEEAELRAERGGPAYSVEDVQVFENTLRTGKRVFNPGITQVVNGLAQGMCCQCILIHERHNGEQEAVYGIIGDSVDADYVCQVATMVVPALQMMARMEGAEHGYEKAGLVRWTNQYLTGAGQEIKHRLEAERKERSQAKQVEAAKSRTALTVITGDALATIKRAAVKEAFKAAYPRTKTTRSRSEYNETANECGRAAGKRVGLYVGIEGSTGTSGHIN